MRSRRARACVSRPGARLVVVVIMAVVVAARGCEQQQRGEPARAHQRAHRRAHQYLTQISAPAAILVSGLTSSSPMISSVVVGLLLYAASSTHTISASLKI